MGMTVFPLPQGTFWQSSGFRTQSRPGHNGIDYAAPEETPLFACEAGTIRVPAEEPGGAGRNLWIETSDGRWWKYFHCSHIVAHAGQRVDAGELIAAVGHTGHVEPPGPGGAHLHLELHRGNPSNPVDPSGECAGVLAGGRWPRWTAHADTAPTNRPDDTKEEPDMTPDDWERIDAKVEEMKWAAVGVAAKAAAASHHYVNDLCRRLDVAELDPFSFNVANDDPVAKTTDEARADDNAYAARASSTDPGPAGEEPDVERGDQSEPGQTEPPTEPEPDDERQPA